MDTKKLLSRVHDLQSYRQRLEDTLAQERDNLKKAQVRLIATEEAQIFIQQTAQRTEQMLAEHIESTVTTALEAVLPEPYTFKMNYVQRRGSTECDLLLVNQEGYETELQDSVGGGVTDIVSLALRVAVHGLSGMSKVLIVDEPTAALSAGRHEQMARLLKIMSTQFGLQVIMASHQDNLKLYADRVFHVEAGEVVQQR